MAPDSTYAAATAVGAGLTAVALVPLTTGMPVVDLVGWALGGGLCAVFWDEREGVTITLRWVLGALAKMVVAALTGIAGSVLALTAGPGLPGMGWLAGTPQWVVAFGLAFGTHKGLPLVAGLVRARMGGAAAPNKEGSNASGGA